MNNVKTGQAALPPDPATIRLTWVNESDEEHSATFSAIVRRNAYFVPLINFVSTILPQQKMNTVRKRAQAARLPLEHTSPQELAQLKQSHALPPKTAIAALISVENATTLGMLYRTTINPITGTTTSEITTTAESRAVAIGEPLHHGVDSEASRPHIKLEYEVEEEEQRHVASCKGIAVQDALVQHASPFTSSPPPTDRETRQPPARLPSLSRSSPLSINRPSMDEEEDQVDLQETHVSVKRKACASPPIAAEDHQRCHNMASQSQRSRSGSSCTSKKQAIDIDDEEGSYDSQDTVLAKKSQRGLPIIISAKKRVMASPLTIASDDGDRPPHRSILPSPSSSPSTSAKRRVITLEDDECRKQSTSRPPPPPPLLLRAPLPAQRVPNHYEDPAKTLLAIKATLEEVSQLAFWKVDLIHHLVLNELLPQRPEMHAKRTNLLRAATSLVIRGVTGKRAGNGHTRVKNCDLVDALPKLFRGEQHQGEKKGIQLAGDEAWFKVAEEAGFAPFRPAEA